MPKLCINIDHIATVREARKIDEPDPIEGARIAIAAGVDGITVHLREDRRHINDRDVLLLSKELDNVWFTLEMAATEEMLEIAGKMKPNLVTLVPEKREELTTEGGLDVIGQKDYLVEYIKKLHEAHLLVSIFINPDKEQIQVAKDIGADFVEIHTGPYANNPSDEEFSKVKESVEFANSIRLRTNVGHGLNYTNTQRIISIPGIEQVHIGHSMIARSVLHGLPEAVTTMKKIIEESMVISS